MRLVCIGTFSFSALALESISHTAYNSCSVLKLDSGDALLCAKVTRGSFPPSIQSSRVQRHTESSYLFRVSNRCARSILLMLFSRSNLLSTDDIFLLVSFDLVLPPRPRCFELFFESSILEEDDDNEEEEEEEEEDWS